MNKLTIFLFQSDNFNQIIVSRIAIGLLLLCGLFSSIHGQSCGTPGSLDASFGSGGVVKTDFRNTRDRAQSVAIQSDGKIVAGGFSHKNTSGLRDFSLSRYNIDGSLDVLFGNGGKVITVVGPAQNSIAYIASVRIQPDGKIAAGGYSALGATVVRYNADGSLDTTFGNNGIAIASHPLTIIEIHSMAMQSDGKFVLVGWTGINNDSVFVVVRFNANGTLDTTFGNNGLATTNFAFDDYGQAVDVTTDGKIVAAGVSYLSSGGTGSRQFAIARYNSDGSPDITFGNGGKVTTAANPNTNFNHAFSLAIQADNKILVGGGTGGAGILRLNINGSRDTSFGNNGLAITVTPTGTSLSYFTSLKIDSTGRILGTAIALSTASPTVNNTLFVVARFSANGIQDASFGNNGVAVTDLGINAELGQAIAIQSDGRIILAGESSQTSTTNSNATADFTLLRYFGNTCVSSVRKPFDFDGDGKSDISVFRPSNGSWYIQQSQNGFTGVAFGLDTDLPAPADFDGDGKTDIAVFRPSNGAWYYLKSSDNSFVGVTFGQNGDLPRPADFDGDGKADINVFRPSNGAWYRLYSSNGSFFGTLFGQNGDKPLIADFDGDGKSDITVFRPSAGAFYSLDSSNGAFRGTAFGVSTDIPTPGDFDGDGKTDIAVFRPSNGAWYRYNSSNGSFFGTLFGQNGDVPATADYDGDGKADIAVFRNGNWYRLNSSNGGFVGFAFGFGTDKPIPAAFQ